MTLKLSLIVGHIESLDIVDESNPLVKKVLLEDLERAKKYIEKYH